MYQLTVSRHQGGSYQFSIREPEVYILQELWSIIRMLRTMEKTDPHMGELADNLTQWTSGVTALGPLGQIVNSTIRAKPSALSSKWVVTHKAIITALNT